MMETWNERFTDAFNASGLSLADFSRQADISHVAPLRWMGTETLAPAAEVYASSLLRACKVLGVRIEWVIDGEIPRRIDEEWPFTTSRQRVEELSALHRILCDKLISDVVAVFAESDREKSA
jgi:hypothetical protein